MSEFSEEETPSKRRVEAYHGLHVPDLPSGFEGLAAETQREVNSGVRATFGAVHTTLR